MGFPHLAGRCRPGGSRFHLRGVSCSDTGVSATGTGPSPPRVALGIRAPDNQRLAGGIGVSTPRGAVSTRENLIFVLGGSGL